MKAGRNINYLDRIYQLTKIVKKNFSNFLIFQDNLSYSSGPLGALNSLPSGILPWRRCLNFWAMMASFLMSWAAFHDQNAVDLFFLLILLV